MGWGGVGLLVWRRMGCVDLDVDLGTGQKVRIIFIDPCKNLSAPPHPFPKKTRNPHE